MVINDVVIGMTGSGGDGIVTIGDFLVSSCAQEGLYALSLKNFGPQIRGGESSSIVNISDSPLGTQGDSINILTVFSWKNYARFNSELLFKDGLIVFVEETEKDEDCPIDPNIKKTFVKVPFAQLAKSINASKSKNILLMGLLEGLLHISKEGMINAIKKKFSNKGDNVVKSSLDALELGIKWINDNKDTVLKGVNVPKLNFKKTNKKMIMTGNDAIGFGALASDCKFFAGYPITPSSEILQFCASEFPKYDGVFVQAEDEISAVGIITGASYAGSKVLTATSGAGLSLMAETIGLASIAEIPLVIADVQRGGPSTGLPTKMEQSDLNIAIYGGHGDSPRIVLAPVDVKDCFYITNKAFYLSEKFQIPVIILSDQFIGNRLEAIDPIDLTKVENYYRDIPPKEKLGKGVYKRYDLSYENGVSPMAFVGHKDGQHYISGLEHGESGRPSSETKTHSIMSEKRYKKFAEIRKHATFKKYGDDNAKIGILGWGSTDGAIKEAVKRAFVKNNIKIKALIPQMLYPINYEVYEDFLKNIDTLIIAEISYSAQFYKLLKINFDLPKNTHKIKRAGGVPFYVEEIYSKIREVSK